VVQARRELHKLRERSAGRVTRRNTKNAYEELYGSPDLLSDYLRPSRLRFYDEVADVCCALSPRTVIDVGCGTGQLVDAVVRKVGDVELAVGLDQARNAIKRARESFPSFEWRVGDIYDLDPELDARFDLVLCTEVLEHVERPGDAVARLMRLRSPDGTVILTVPDGAIDDWEGHVNFWTEEELNLFLAPFGSARVRRIDEGQTLLAVIASDSA
jgi:2-polyprenyl-3-methyl-5-hydroxy-6-metoxy-1,4-benzoquinol methylase